MSEYFCSKGSRICTKCIHAYSLFVDGYKDRCEYRIAPNKIDCSYFVKEVDYEWSFGEIKELNFEHK